ncbi:glucose-6-phosphate dehydrogenase assembly protein OpcA [Actinacidiphila yanglinensis]|uniref:Glucose-6-phosphate dehydrogenase assembly protein OpcA n=1 Tax=Actinacidiphila yanglinensis TaxID=310779 RepID=A0A1H5TXB9_9ACTN|nr:glucose-6-phosphate dehydrogenase assembly protein OpcA [Actinacidiphila yanglinensis]SEF66667.1 glucose-6-phosphate dehydrogenase assembly protein OpcA [Actinacidiphila yanglinensis]
MRIDLTDTTSSKINAGLIEARRAIGTPAVGMVLTLVIVTDEGSAYDALKAAHEASKEHPSRILVVIKRPGRSPRDRAMARLDAEVVVGDEAGTGETVVLRMHGELANHAESVVLPLLLPDAPAVCWWPDKAPEHAAEDPLGRLAARRITDSAAAEDPVGSIVLRAKTYAPGDTDLAWTRITPWRSMLAAALDQKHHKIERAAVEGEAYNPSAELLALWLSDRLGVPVERKVSSGPGLTAVRLFTSEGDICLDRPEGGLAELAVPGQPDRHVALKRRETSELIAEELRRLDPDDIYRATVKFGLKHLLNSDGSSGSVAKSGKAGEPAEGASKAAPAKKAASNSGSGKAAAEK